MLVNFINHKCEKVHDFSKSCIWEKPQVLENVQSLFKKHHDILKSKMKMKKEKKTKLLKACTCEPP